MNENGAIAVANGDGLQNGREKRGKRVRKDDEEEVDCEKE